MLVNSTKVVETDKWVTDHETGSALSNRVFIRLIAKQKRFTKVDFHFTTFDACYLRECMFDSCNFTGCRFISTNFHKSSFSGCTFDYATFEKTDIDSRILDSECPVRENLKLRFARSLRVNFQQLGDVAAVNKAIQVELRATEAHLRKIWRSKESYYQKYSSLDRLRGFVDWVNFKLLDYIWGNGESAWKLSRAVAVVLLIIAIVDGAVFGNTELLSSYRDGLLNAPQILLGTHVPAEYPTWYLTVITFVRLIAFGFFMSVVIKRFNRR